MKSITKLPAPRYIYFYENYHQEFLQRIEKAKAMLKECTVCPRECRIDRNHQLGYCRIGNILEYLLFSLILAKKDV